MPKSKRHLFETLFQQLKVENPFALMDIGVMGGIASQWQPLKSFIKVIAFEPDEREFTLLQQQKNVQYLNWVVHERSEPVAFHLTKGHGKSSILKPNQDLVSQFCDSERFQVEEVIDIPQARVKSLDQLIEEGYIRQIDFIKLDAQGSEYGILNGGRKHVLPNLIGAQVEVEFEPVYENQPLFNEVDQLMRNHGFQLMDIRRSYWKRKDFQNFAGKGQLIFGDALYFKRFNHFDAEGQSSNGRTPSKREQLIKQLIVALVYQMFDYAVGLLKTGASHGLLNGEESCLYLKELSQVSHKGLGTYTSFFGRLHRASQTVLNKLKPQSYLGWADSDREIGNIRDK